MRVLGILVGLSLSGAAQAQLSPAAKMGQVAANQLGILEYCHDHGYAGQDAVAAEREAFLDAPSTRLSTARSEELGRQGYSVTPDAEQLSVNALAIAQDTTVRALCKDLASSSLAFQASRARH